MDAEQQRAYAIKSPATMGFLAQAVDIVYENVQKALDQRDKKIDLLEKTIEQYTVVCEALEVKIKSLEDNPPFQYRGVYEKDKTYPKGSFVTHTGSVWYCTEDTIQPPTYGIHCWRLAVKQGQPGRDAR
jgi:hypothetical protein